MFGRPSLSPLSPASPSAMRAWISEAARCGTHHALESTVCRGRSESFEEGSDIFGRLHRRFTSFENVLIVLNDLDDYQCVWNAEGITDNTATPGGISHVFWSPGQSNAYTYKMRGTRVCRVWNVASNVDMPLLPLQNTVSCHEEMLVNTEAYVISYGFS